MAKEKPKVHVKPEVRKYACSRWPYLRIGGGLRFDAGYLKVEGEDQIKRVEATDAWKCGQIVEIKSKAPARVLSVQEEIEEQIEEQMTKLRPVARRGSVNSNTV